MSAQTQDRVASRRIVRRALRPVAANVRFYKNALVACVAGYYAPATGAAGEVLVGTCYRGVSNLGGSAGDKNVDVLFFRDRDLFLVANDGGAPVVAANRESFCSILDDQTVTLYTEAKGRAAIVYDVDAEGVWVEPVPPAAPRSYSGTGTLVAGTVTITAPITATSRITVTMKDAGAGAITGFADLEVPSASRNVGAGTFVVRAIDASKAQINTAVCSFDWTVTG